MAKLSIPTTGIDRRKLLQFAGASGVAAATTGVYAPAIAQARVIKIGYVSPATGPLAEFAAADQFMLQQFREATKNGIRKGNVTYQVFEIQ